MTWLIYIVREVGPSNKLKNHSDRMESSNEFISNISHNLYTIGVIEVLDCRSYIEGFIVAKI